MTQDDVFIAQYILQTQSGGRNNKMGTNEITLVSSLLRDSGFVTLPLINS